MEKPEDSVRVHLLMVIISVAGAAAIAWLELPETHRMMLVLTTRDRLRKLLHRAARRAGHLGMGSELAGHRPSAGAGYGVAYRLARLRDRV